MCRSSLWNECVQMWESGGRVHVCMCVLLYICPLVLIYSTYSLPITSCLITSVVMLCHADSGTIPHYIDVCVAMLRWTK